MVFVLFVKGIFHLSKVKPLSYAAKPDWNFSSLIILNSFGFSHLTSKIRLKFGNSKNNMCFFVAIAHNGSPVSAVRLNGDKRAIYGCLNEVGNLSFIKMPAWHLPAC